jgi:hypothetical protein
MTDDKPNSLPVVVEPTYGPAPIVKHLTEADAFRDKLEAHLRRRAVQEGAAAVQESSEARRQREAQEQWVTENARRLQAEVRQHTVSFLKEYFEGHSLDVSEAIMDFVSDRITKGIAAMQANQTAHLDRIAAQMRAQMRAFVAEFAGKPKVVRRKKR